MQVAPFYLPLKSIEIDLKFQNRQIVLLRMKPRRLGLRFIGTEIGCRSDLQDTFIYQMIRGQRAFLFFFV